MNPVVVAATFIAFPTEPRMAIARFLAALATACVTGWLWHRFGRPDWILDRVRPTAHTAPATRRWTVFAETARQDLVSAGGFLVLGALFSAALTVFVPAS